MNLRKARGFRKKYQVEITETFQKVVDISAFSPDEAIAKATQQYREREIVLDSSDFIDYNVQLLR